MKEIRCGNCGSTIKIGDGEGVPFDKLPDGIHYLVPSVVRNENVGTSKSDDRLKALKDAGINITKLQSLMQSTKGAKELFDVNDPIVEEISRGGFIDNPELFRRFITAQTFRLLKLDKSWTAAVRKIHNIKYVYNQTKRELALVAKLSKKCPNDIRLEFFTLDDLKRIFIELIKYNDGVYKENKELAKERISVCCTYHDLIDTIDSYRWRFSWKCTAMPRTWLNCYKGAGAYYTLQNIIRTHGMVLPRCKDMNESLNFVQNIFTNICSYKPQERRWDILMSVLTNAVKETKFELKY